ncbi:MAG: hypothetical protein IAE97_07815 [Chthoniobacterales bacterium]|nr:hypothetical protein [Chthoniobacterales bacterium]
MKNHHRYLLPGCRLGTFALAVLAMVATAGAQQTFFNMATSNYSQDFSSISSWSNNYAAGTGAENWRVAASATGSDVTNTTVFASGTSGGVQKGTNAMVFLATGVNTGGTDLLLNFSGRTAGNISFNWSKIVNTANTNARSSDLKLQYSTNNGSNFTDITGYTIPRINNNTNTESGNLDVVLPTEISGQAQAVIRFFYWNNGMTNGAGNRPKWNIDDVLVTSSAAVGAPSITSFSPESGLIGTSVTITGTNFTGATAVAFNGSSASFTEDSDTQITATVPSGATTGPISVTAPSGTGFSTTDFVVSSVSVSLPSQILEGQSDFGTVNLSEAPESDVEVTIESSHPADLEVESPVTIFAETTESYFSIEAPLDSTIDSNVVVTVTPIATGYASIPDTITVVNIDALSIPLTTLVTNSYTQNFDSMGTTTISNIVSGTNGVQTSFGDVVSTNLTGWFATKITGSAGTTGLVAGDGSSTSGALYNFGTTADTNRSLGAQSSGSITPAFGALIYNDTGETLNSVWINFTGKFWRSSTSATNVLVFGYGKVDGTNVNTGNFLTSSNGVSPLAAANVVGPAPVATNGPLDGNNITNQILISNVAIPVQLAPGETMFVRWQDFDNAGSDAGLAIDDLNLTASTNAPAPVLASVTVNPFSITEAQAEVTSSVVSDSGSALTSRGFVYSETLFNTNPTIGGSNVVVITNEPAEVGSFTNTLTSLLASTSYTVKSFAVNAAGTNYSAAVAFNTLAPSPQFNGSYFQAFNGLTNTDFPAGWRCLSTSNLNSYAGDWNATNSTVGGFYGRTNIPGILGYLHTGSSGILSNRLTLVNNTGGTLTNLWVSYAGEVNTLNPTNNLRFPEWTVVVQGQTNSGLAYSTAGGTNAFLSAEITGLDISNGQTITISWSSDRGAGSGSSRMIGMTSVRVATNAPGAPTIGVSGSLTNFTTTVGNASASQSFNASGTDLVSDITVTAPADYEVSLNDADFSPSVNLSPSGGTVSSTPVYVRIAASAPVGNPAGQVNLASTGATDANVAVTGTVSSGGGGFTAWVDGGPTNATTVGLYAVGGASSPTANDAIPSVTTVTSSNLSITAIVRTNDPNLSVFGQATTSLSLGPWSTNGVTMTNSPNQSGVPEGTARQIFSIDRGTNTRLNLRLESILAP